MLRYRNACIVLPCFTAWCHVNSFAESVWRLHRKQLQGKKKKKKKALFLSQPKSPNGLMKSLHYFFFLCMISMHSSFDLSIEPSSLKLYTAQILNCCILLCCKHKGVYFAEGSLIFHKITPVVLCLLCTHILLDKTYAVSCWLSLAGECH